MRTGFAQLTAFSARRGRVLTVVIPTLFAMVLAGLPYGADARTIGNRSTDQTTASKAAPGPILAVVSLAKQRIWVYGSAGLIAQSAVSTGTTGFRTPTGVFSVVQKSRFHRSNIYSDAPMPYMQRLTWSGIALHAGVVPGYPASHGCIRLPHQFAVELWSMTKIGARVVVVPDDASVFDIEHPRLPVPTLTPTDTIRGGDQAKSDAEPRADRSAGIVGVAHAEPSGDAALPSAKLLNPIERAKAARLYALADAAAKSKAGRIAVETSAAKAAEGNRAIAALRGAELTLTLAHAKRDAATKAAESIVGPEAIERVRSALAEVDTRLAEAEKAAGEARAIEAVKTAEAIAAAKAAWIAEKASTEAAAILKATERNTEPISIFVSKKAGRVYIRQAWAPIYEALVSFKDPEIPLGTHVYVATAAEGDGKALRWRSVSLPPSRPAEPGQNGKGSPPNRPVAAPRLSARHTPQTAATALERFEFGEETRRFIEDKVWTGASLIVSDEAISNETGVTTDFIVLTR